MTVEGVSMNESDSYSFATNGRYSAVGRGTSYGQSVQCSRPRNDEDRCMARAGAASAAVKADWSPNGRNAVIFLGFYVFILPGLIASLIFNGQQHDAAEHAGEVFKHAFQECMEATQSAPE